MHGTPFAFAIARGFTHELGHHAIEITTFGHQMTMTAMGRSDVIVVVQRSTKARGNRFFTYIEVEEAREFVSFGEPSGCFFEKSNANHPPV
jgi:hypothetical protein